MFHPIPAACPAAFFVFDPLPLSCGPTLPVYLNPVRFHEIENIGFEVSDRFPDFAEREKLYSKWGLSTNHIDEMKLSNYARFFESIVQKGANAKVAAGLLL